MQLVNCSNQDFCFAQEDNATLENIVLVAELKNRGAVATPLLRSTKQGNESSPGNMSSGDHAAIYDFSLEFMFFSLSLIIPCGLVCNTVSIVVFMSRKLRNRAASWYLAALAVSDDISLLAIMFDYWLKADRIGISVVKTSNALCLTVTHLSYASRLFSAWLVTSFTIERFIGVVFPLKRASLSTTSHARKVIAFECVTCIVCTSFILCTIGIVNEEYGIECDILPQRKHVYLICNVIFLVFGSIVIPILTICTLNMFILQKIYQRKKRFVRKNMKFGQTREISYKSKRGYNIATVLLVVSTVFVILNIPYCVCWFVLFFRYHVSGGSLNWSLFAAKYITSVPYFLNYAINFALYSLCARAFRVELCRLLKCTPCRRLSERTRCTETKATSVDTHVKRERTPEKMSPDMYEKVLALAVCDEHDFLRIMRNVTDPRDT